jgi:DNA primase large subunit
LFLASMSAVLALPKESCVGFFRGAPDFSESTTSYQVDHVYQHGYTPSGCGKLKINHNCPVLPGDDRLCDQPWLDHPLKYIRATQRWNAKNQAAQQQAQVAPPTTEAPKDSPADDSKNESV